MLVVKLFIVSIKLESLSAFKVTREKNDVDSASPYQFYLVFNAPNDDFSCFIVAHFFHIRKLQLQYFAHEYTEQYEGHNQICERYIHAATHRRHYDLQYKEDFVERASIFVNAGNVDAIR